MSLHEQIVGYLELQPASPVVDALRAVVQLHRPYSDPWHTYRITGLWCRQCSMEKPCTYDLTILPVLLQDVALKGSADASASTR